MQEPVELNKFLEQVKQRKQELGITDEMIEQLRNSGTRRTQEKRELLARIQQRCRDLGLDPYKANF